MIDNSLLSKLFFLLLTLSVTLVFGLHPKDFGGEHTPYVNSAGILSFTKYSIATTRAQQLPMPDDSKPADELTLDARLHIPQMPDLINRFSVIYSINDEHGDSLMLLGQWKNYLVIMSGDDYANQNHQPRITIPLDSVKGYDYPHPLHVQIEATATQTTVMINQQPMAQSTDYIVPFTHSSFNVSLGNTLDRKQGWMGTLSEFEFDIFKCPSEGLGEIGSPCPTVYSVDLHNVVQSPTIATNTPSIWTLESPYAVLSTHWLSADSLKYWKTPAFYRDIVINLLGFVPLTLALFILLAARYPLSTVAVLTISAAIVTSLFIESAQIFLPSRTSSIVDLAVNSLAGIFTTLICCVGVRALNRKG